MVREARHDDIPALVKLVESFFANGELDGTGLSLDPDTVEFFIQDSIDLEERAVMVAEHDGEIIGAIAGGVAPWMFNANILMLMELGWFIPKSNREKHSKAALQLLRHFTKWGKDKGASVMVIVSTKREESPRVVEFYERMGLRHVDSSFIGGI